MIAHRIVSGRPSRSILGLFALLLVGLIVTWENPAHAQTPTATPVTLSGCADDCDNNGMVEPNEVTACIDAALISEIPPTCMACDHDGDGEVTVDDLVAGVDALIHDCPAPVTLDDLQTMIFTPTCAVPACHDANGTSGNLKLVAGQSYENLVNVTPFNTVAAANGLLRVKPFDLASSFLLIKLTGPPPDEGLQMPEVGGPLSPELIQMVRQWILEGAPQ